MPGDLPRSLTRFPRVDGRARLSLRAVRCVGLAECRGAKPISRKGDCDSRDASKSLFSCKQPLYRCVFGYMPRPDWSAGTGPFHRRLPGCRRGGKGAAKEQKGGRGRTWRLGWRHGGLVGRLERPSLARWSMWDEPCERRDKGQGTACVVSRGPRWTRGTKSNCEKGRWLALTIPLPFISFISHGPMPIPSDHEMHAADGCTALHAPRSASTALN